MFVTIKGASTLEYAAFSEGNSKIFDEKMEALAVQIMQRLRKQQQVDFDVLGLMVSTNTSGLNPTGPRTKSYAHFFDE